MCFRLYTNRYEMTARAVPLNDFTQLHVYGVWAVINDQQRARTSIGNFACNIQKLIFDVLIKTVNNLALT